MSGTEIAAAPTDDSSAMPVSRPDTTLTAAALAEVQVSQPDQYQLRDLSAQEAMAGWAMWMFVAAVATFVITSLGTLMIWRQIKLTKDAVREAVAGTEATREANEIAREIGQAQARCYLSPKDVKFRIDTCAIPHVSMSVLNSGQSPARNLKWTFQARIRVMPDCWEWANQATEPGGSWDIAAQQQEPLSLGIADNNPVPQGDLSDLLLEPEVRVTVQIKAVWADVFGEEWSETWLFQAMGPMGVDKDVDMFPDFPGPR